MDILTRLIAYFVLLFAITIHEAAHGWTAKKFGDPTAFYMGRVTLNPIPHIDPIGTILMPLLMSLTGIPFIGWAKPVPVNPLNLRNPRRDHLWISASGPLSNISAGLVMLFLLFLLKSFRPEVKYFLYGALSGSGSAAGFNPLGGLTLLLFYGTMINVILAVFNLLPIPPLDGSGVLEGLLPPRQTRFLDQIRPYGFLIIIGLFFIGVFDLILRPIQYFVYSVVFS